MLKNVITNEEKALNMFPNIENMECVCIGVREKLIEMAEWKDAMMNELVHKMKEYLIVEQGFDYDSCAMDQFEDFIGVEHELYNPFETEDE